MATAGARITGDKKLRSVLQDLGRKSRTINRQAINKATTPILQAVRGECPVDHGDLRKSMTKKVTNRGDNANGIVGADEGYVVATASGEKLQLGSTKEESKAIVDAARDDGGVIRPSKYDHLVEYGHVTPGGEQIPAQPFMRNGWDASIDQAQRTYEASLAAGIEKAASAK